MPEAGFAFCYRFRVRWSEVDPQNVVFNARYLDYGDLGLTEYWRAVDFRNPNAAGPMDFHVAHAEVDYKKPIKPDELIDIWCRTERFGTTSMTILMEIHGAGDARDDLRAIIREVHVHVDLDTHRPKPLPQSVRERFTAFDARADIVRRGDLSL
jgi:acyl-CoA thioester hydrolase